MPPWARPENHARRKDRDGDWIRVGEADFGRFEPRNDGMPRYKTVTGHGKGLRPSRRTLVGERI